MYIKDNKLAKTEYIHRRKEYKSNSTRLLFDDFISIILVV